MNQGDAFEGEVEPASIQPNDLRIAQKDGMSNLFFHEGNSRLQNLFLFPFREDDAFG